MKTSYVVSKLFSWEELRKSAYEDIASIKRIKFSAKNFPEKTTVYLFCLNPNANGCKITEARLVVNGQLHMMQLKLKSVLATFYFVDVYIGENQAQTLGFEFLITISETVENMSLQLVDSRVNDLWNAATERQLTDVEFVVGQKTFHAHKCIVAARSPVFVAMFRAKMVESKTNRVIIRDIDAGTFETFLKYIYTGRLDDPADNPQLLMAADKYQVDTLKNLCSNRREPSIEGELETSFLTLSNLL